MARKRNTESSDTSLTFRERFEALRNLPAFFKQIWQTSPSLTLLNLFLRLLRSAVPTMSLYVGKLIIDEVVRLATIHSSDLTHLWVLIAIEFGLAIGSDLLSRGISLSESLLGDWYAHQTSVRLMKHAATLDLSQFENPTFYDKLERARQQTAGRTQLLTQTFSQLQDFLTITSLAVGLISFAPWLLVLLLVAVIPSFLGELHFNAKSYSLLYGWTPQRRELDYYRYLGASDDTAKEVKLFGLSDFLINRYQTLSEQYFQENRKLAVERAGWGSLLLAIGTVGYYSAYGYMIFQTVQGRVTLGDLTFLAGSFRQVRSLLEGILGRFNSISQGALYLKDLFEFFEIQPQIISPVQPRSFPSPIQQGFVFDNVGFKYPNSEKWAVRNLSFTLKAGEKMALVGENGAGKTTLVKLLGRLYDPDEGQILLDGYSLKDYDLEELRQHIGVIFQDYLRFQFSAGDNIAVGDIMERENRLALEKAAEHSLADQVIAGLPHQYDQPLGRRFSGGVELSGGQWQKVALARAYLREADLLILDEPTSALDARAEYEVFQRFAELTKGKTAVLISHRFSTVRMADRILVLEGGKVLEIGTHEELLLQNGRYAELFELQAEGYR
ncbi:ABC transporter ATP-binding protein [Siphonobacter sp. SORGH_AS_1065]|uniref:ABC transporter ATP-binding protein n=1 Tax=Siphonobacter sp. SORGH_AS_1065 TaxID=3041795 RepID=UPI00278089C1|nr:ABC transporter ATP-binding protein [Siphonobacter sp. SORGH_AS_1065]MDQ1087512.1 ATP-binding cassette subfamily B protein [Siphonobacter sp. SORGH_AS_1065]